jgi:hypothetical protein
MFLSCDFVSRCLAPGDTWLDPKWRDDEGLTNGISADDCAYDGLHDSTTRLGRWVSSTLSHTSFIHWLGNVPCRPRFSTAE